MPNVVLSAVRKEQCRFLFAVIVAGALAQEIAKRRTQKPEENPFVIACGHCIGQMLGTMPVAVRKRIMEIIDKRRKSLSRIIKDIDLHTAYMASLKTIITSFRPKPATYEAYFVDNLRHNYAHIQDLEIYNDENFDEIVAAMKVQVNLIR